MKLGIMGTGMIVHDMLKMLHKVGPEKTYILATENTKEEAQKLIDDYHLDGYYTDFDEFLAADIDTTYVGLPNSLHYSFAKKSIQAHKNVIIEKPVTTNSDELKDLKVTADENGVFFFEAMPAHYLPAVKSVKDNLDKVGDIKIVMFNYSQYSSRYDAFKRGEILPAFDPKKSGGALMDINIYNINGAISLFGKPEEFKYYANIERGIDTSGMLVMDYDHFKVLCVGAKDCKSPYTLYIQGDKACISIESPFNQTKAYSVLYNDGRVENYEFERDEHRLLYEFLEFKRIIEEKDVESYENIYQRSYDVCVIMEEARRSAGIRFPGDKE